MRWITIDLTLTLLALWTVSDSWAAGEKREKTEWTVTTEMGTGRFGVEIIQRDGTAQGEFETSPSVRVGDGSTADFPLIIQEVYATVSEYAKVGNRDLRFELSDFETLNAERFDEIYYADTATLPDGLLLQLTRRTFTDEVNSLKTVEYVPRWKEVHTDWTSIPEGPRMLAMTLEEVLLELAADDSTWTKIRAVTRFNVRVTYQDQVRSYKAAFFWLSGESKGDWRMYAVDHITNGVNTVLQETIPLEGIKTPKPDRGVMPPSDGSKIDNPFGCKTTSDMSSHPQQQRTSDNGHSSGGHVSDVDMFFNCSCSSDCTNWCSGSLGYTRCSELPNSTVWDACHKFGVAEDQSTVGVQNGMTNAPSCAAGFSCAQKACAFCLCGVTVQVTVAGTQVTFGSSGDWVSNYSGSFTCALCEANPPPDPPSSPILINLSGGFELTGLDQAVHFDLDADGENETVSWTDGTGDDAFLVLDRNANGQIDDGTELFGTVTPQPESGVPNGFIALGVYDLEGHGGNGDGWISEADETFDELRLWLDSNHDGVSQAVELETLSSAGVLAIDLEYVVSQRRDRHGNEFRWRSNVRTVQGATRHAADVIFLAQ